MSFFIKYPNSIDQWMLCHNKAAVNYFSTSEGLIGIASCPRVCTTSLKKMCDQFQFYNKSFQPHKNIDKRILNVTELIIILRDPYERLHSALQHTYNMEVRHIANKKIEWNNEHYMPQAYFDIITEEGPNKTFFYYNNTILETVFNYLSKKYKFPINDKPILYDHKSEITYDKSCWYINIDTQTFFNHAKEVYQVDKILISKTKFYNEFK